MTAPPPGGASFGPYRVVRELGRGGMGVVFLAEHETLRRRVALKVLLEASPEQAQRFVAEARATARLDHPGVVRILEIGPLGARPWMALELVEGTPLQEVLKRSGRLPPEQAVDLALQLARALEHAHARGVLHRDLKPANVLVTAEGRARLVDFGLARGGADQRLTATGTVMGTPAYMPPEQAAGEVQRVDARADVYGLGATLYDVLAGRPPFGGATPINTLSAVLSRPPEPLRPQAPEVDAELERVVLRCLAKEPDERYASASELVAALEGWSARRAAAAPGSAGPAPSPDVVGAPSVAAPAGRRPLAQALWLGGAIVLAGLAIAGGLVAASRTREAGPGAASSDAGRGGGGPAGEASPVPEEEGPREAAGPADPASRSEDPGPVAPTSLDLLQDPGRDALELHDPLLARVLPQGVLLTAPASLPSGLSAGFRWDGGPLEVEAEVEVAYLYPYSRLLLVIEPLSGGAAVGMGLGTNSDRDLGFWLEPWEGLRVTTRAGVQERTWKGSYGPVAEERPRRTLRLRYDPADSLSGEVQGARRSAPAPPAEPGAYRVRLGLNVTPSRVAPYRWDHGRVLIHSWRLTGQVSLLEPEPRGRLAWRILEGEDVNQELAAALAADPRDPHLQHLRLAQLLGSSPSQARAELTERFRGPWAPDVSWEEGMRQDWRHHLAYLHPMNRTIYADAYREARGGDAAALLADGLAILRRARGTDIRSLHRAELSRGLLDLLAAPPTAFTPEVLELVARALVHTGDPEGGLARLEAIEKDRPGATEGMAGFAAERLRRFERALELWGGSRWASIPEWRRAHFGRVRACVEVQLGRRER